MLRRHPVTACAKRRLPLANRLLLYVAARIHQPNLIVETGIHDGLGSLVLLRALERNGRGGLLISFDRAPDAGWLVDDRLARNWRRVIGPVETELEPALSDLEVGMSVHDTGPAERPPLVRPAGRDGKPAPKAPKADPKDEPYVYQVALTDEAGNITAVQKFDSLDEARNFAADVGRWQAHQQELQQNRQGPPVVRSSGL